MTTAVARPEPSVGDAERAIVRTVSYAGMFESPLTMERLHRMLMDVRADEETLRECLQLPWVRERVEVSAGLVHPFGRRGWLELRSRRRDHTRRLVERHRLALGVLARLPFVRMVGLSGACAHDNATDADVDVFVIAKRGRAWSVYLAAVAASRLLGVRRTLCVNYVLDESARELPERDLFTASEVAGLRPLAGREAYRRFVLANAWLAERFPNFFFERHRADSAAVPRAGAPAWCEWLLELGPAQALEALSRRFMGARLRRKGAQAAGFVLSPARLKLHVLDHRDRLLAAWRTAQSAADHGAEA